MPVIRNYQTPHQFITAPEARYKAPEPLEVADPRARKILDMLRKALATTEECPDTQTLAQYLGCSGGTVSLAFRKLEAANVISVERSSNYRVVTFLDTGKKLYSRRAHPS